MESQSANQLIKLSRKRKGLTQQELADQARGNTRCWTIFSRKFHRLYHYCWFF